MAYIEYRGHEDDPHPSQAQSLPLNLLLLVHRRRPTPPQYYFCLLEFGIIRRKREPPSTKAFLNF